MPNAFKPRPARWNSAALPTPPMPSTTASYVSIMATPATNPLPLHRKLQHGQIVFDFPRANLFVIAFPLAGFQLQERLGDRAERGTDDVVVAQMIQGGGQRLR